MEDIHGAGHTKKSNSRKKGGGREGGKKKKKKGERGEVVQSYPSLWICKDRQCDFFFREKKEGKRKRKKDGLRVLANAG